MTQVIERIWLAVVLVMGPLNAIATRRALAGRRLALDGAAPEALRGLRRRAYASTLLGLTGLGLVTLAVDAFGSRLGLRALQSLPGRLVPWALGTLAACVILSLGFVTLRRAAGIPPSRASRLLIPGAAGDWGLFALVCVMAGLVEEFVCRGFGLGQLARFVGPAPAVAIVSLSFAAGHLYQDRLGALRACVLGIGLAIPVLATGSLVPSILAHAATDLLTPLWFPDGRREERRTA